MGEVAITNMLPVKFTPALLTESSLRKQSAMRRPQVERDCKSSGDPEVDLEVWQQTMQECEKGWLAGPFLQAKSHWMLPCPNVLASSRSIK